MRKITGNTYPIKDQLKALGGCWNAAGKFWEVPDDKEAAAKRSWRCPTLQFAAAA